MMFRMMLNLTFQDQTIPTQTVVLEADLSGKTYFLNPLL